ncbi:hypothetical protein [Paenibacillus sp. J2TS4]|uniref:hypothetical protein n=1 Tax=Paenibacillus sp. J2TS4 TaxID=2807194 RepID=UPI001AFE5F11|nr:hypothetical protein [Paenibacillus sp. J2TS4]GIP32930.1 hypothetical protein J2TS4_21400 [Paenibacillus sp. J2TS4]
MSSLGPNSKANMMVSPFGLANIHAANVYPNVMPNVAPAALYPFEPFPCHPVSPVGAGACDSVGVILVLFILLVIILRSRHKF